MHRDSHPGQMDRRDLIKTVAAAAGAASVSSLADYAIAEEPRAPFIEAYADRLSCLPGESVGLCVSTGAERYSVEVGAWGQSARWCSHGPALRGLRTTCRPTPHRMAADGPWH